MKCPHCPREFKTRLQLGRHVSTRHREQWKPSRPRARRSIAKAKTRVEVLRSVIDGTFSPETAQKEVTKLVEYARRLETENRDLRRQVDALSKRLQRITGFVASLDKEGMTS
jgi:hypothetical protein